MMMVLARRRIEFVAAFAASTREFSLKDAGTYDLVLGQQARNDNAYYSTTIEE